MEKVVIKMYSSYCSVIWPVSKHLSDLVMQKLSIFTGVKYNYSAGVYDVTGDKDKLFDFIYAVSMQYPWVKVQ